jgi:2-polyprenyl-3-methyl-5-hydroxy-6-metoxy-1,4-benzoquinol methylase
VASPDEDVNGRRRHAIERDAGGAPPNSRRPGSPFGPPERDVPQASLHWDRRYAADERIWGDGPSELARLAVARLRTYATPELTVLDVGCGYGRDTRYLAGELACRALGIDGSPAAIEAARKEHASALRRSREAQFDVEYLASDVASLAAGPERAGPYDVVFTCNVYHLLGPIGRREFAAALAAVTRPDGLLFLSTMSPRDPQHYAVGEPVSGEERSWVDKVYLHFCTAEELTRDFGAFEILDLDERGYDEPQASGQPHHHTSWFLEGRRR